MLYVIDNIDGMLLGFLILFNPCIANKKVNRQQQTIKFHVDNLMLSYKDKRVNDEFLKLLQDKYGKHGAMKGN